MIAETTSNGDMMSSDERAYIYRLLAHFLSAPPDEYSLEHASRLSGDNSPLGQTITAFALSASISRPPILAKQFHRLFIGLGGGELTPFASRYRMGSLHERPLVQIRADMQRLGIRRIAGNAEPEDHVVSILEMMCMMLAEPTRFPQQAAASVYRRHAAPWMPAFATDLSAIEDADFYAALGRFFVAFLDREQRLNLNDREGAA